MEDRLRDAIEGILHFKWKEGVPTEITILQADPLIWASNYALRAIIEHPNPSITITPLPINSKDTLTNRYLTIYALNGTYIWRIKEHDPIFDGYTLQWPD